MKVIIFILEIKENRGRGHWYRCLELTKRLKNYNQNIKILWLIDYINDYFAKHLRELNIYFEIGNYRNPKKVIESIEKNNADLVMIDLMEVEKEYILKIKKKRKVITIGGSGLGLSYSNISINGMFKRQNFIDQFHGDDLYIGPQYIIFRSEMYDYYKQLEIRNGIKNIVISLGADYEGIGIIIAKIIKKEYPKMDISVITCTEKKIDEIKDIKVFKSLKRPWSIFKTADVFITCGGMTAFEAVYLGIPLVLIPITKIQLDASQRFEEKGLGILVKFNRFNIDQVLIKALNMIKDKEIRILMRENSKNLFKKDNIKIVEDIIYREL